MVVSETVISLFLFINMVKIYHIYIMQNSNYNYHQKIPVKNKHKRCHYYKKDNKWKPKIKFNTYQEAEEYLKSSNKLDEYNIYICPICGKYHIGHKNEETKGE